LCNFFSAISNGKGKVLFFTLEDIQKIEKQGNKEEYNWNSHTSIADYNNIKGKKEDKWNKWEYDNEKKELNIDGQYVAKDDSKTVKKVIEKYLTENNALYCQKVYNGNSGDWNSGYMNSGNMNSGNRNSGNMNSGDWNSGNWNLGYMNSGNWNSGDWNSGYMNSGYMNSGNRNSGNWNSGDWNSGDWNSGYMNSDEPKIRIFNKYTNKKRGDINFPKYFYFDLNEWVYQTDMNDEEKKKYWWYKTTGGYLRKVDYKEAWKQSFNKATKEDVKKTLKLPNFNYKIFEEITGITKKMLENE